MMSPEKKKGGEAQTSPWLIMTLIARKVAKYCGAAD
jgi:hypothetical protein